MNAVDVDSTEVVWCVTSKEQSMMLIELHLIVLPDIVGITRKLIMENMFSIPLQI